MAELEELTAEAEGLAAEAETARSKADAEGASEEDKTAAEEAETHAEEAKQAAEEAATPAHEESIPYGRFKDKVDEAKEAGKRADTAEQKAREAEIRLQERQRSSPTAGEAKERWQREFSDDEFGATSRLAEDRAFGVVEYERKKDDMVEELADGNPEYAKHERQVKRKIRGFYPANDQELKNRVELEFQAAIGRGVGDREAKARKKGKDDAIKGKKVIGDGTGTGTTVPKSDKGKPLTSEEKMFADGLGVSTDKVKEAEKKGRYIE